MQEIFATAPTALYLRLPARATPTGAARLPLSFAVTARGRLQRIGDATLSELVGLLQQAQRVVVLLAASDVSLFRIVVPPLPAARLKAALPALIEDRVIGDPATCAIAVAPTQGANVALGTSGSERLVAVADRAWLQDWLDALRRHGARRLSALPFALCLPLPAGQVSASVVEHAGQRELALRLSAQEGMGLPLSSEPIDQLPGEVLQLLVTFAGQHPVQLALPSTLLKPFRDAYGQFAAGAAVPNHAQAGDAATTTSMASDQIYPVSTIDLREENWAAWVEGAGRVPLDLLTAMTADEGDGPDWPRWRWPLGLAAACVLVNVAALNGDWWQLRNEGQQLRDAMARSFHRNFPDEVLSDPVAQMRQKLATSRRAAGEFAPGDFMALAAALGDAWAEAGTAIGADARAIAALEYRDMALEVRFKPGQQPSLDAARSALAARGLEAKAINGNGAQWEIRSTQ